MKTEQELAIESAIDDIKCMIAQLEIVRKELRSSRVWACPHCKKSCEIRYATAIHVLSYQIEDWETSDSSHGILCPHCNKYDFYTTYRDDGKFVKEYFYSFGGEALFYQHSTLGYKWKKKPPALDSKP
jgi:hypothetical protein